MFWLDEENGALSVVKPLDREQRTHYNFTIVAKDQGEEEQLAARAAVSIRVLDKNDNPPQWIEASTPP